MCPTNDATQRADRVGGVRHTIVGGAVHDAKALLADVRAIVAAEKERRLVVQSSA